MAQAIEIRLWCDPCLEANEQTTGDTITVPALFGEPAFELEACEQHAKTLRDAVDELRAFGRAPEKVTKASGPRVRPDDAPGKMECPVCKEGKPSLAALRSHLRTEHGKSLPDVGIGEANFRCSVCWSGFEKGQGFSAHRRSIHPNADPDGRAVAQKGRAA